MAKGSIQHNDSARHILLRLNPLKLSDVVDDEPSGFSPPYNTKRKSCDFLSAVRAGFEPAVRLPVRQFSKLVVSATHPSHQN